MLGNGILPQDPGFPADIFTCCLTTPIKIALHVFCSKSLLGSEGVTRDAIEHIPGKQTDRKTPLGELNWIFTAITDTIAWNALPRSLFQKLFRQDLLVASLFRNFLLAQRVMRAAGCTPVSHPRLPMVDQHPMWLAWDLAAETCLLQLPDIIDSDKEYVPSPFFSEQLTAFELWLDHGCAEKAPPEQLPVVLQVLLSQVHRLRALVLLGRFIDMGSWAVDLALSVGIFPYILKLLQTSAADLRQTLVFIWAKIVAWDLNPQVQNDLTKDGGYLYFIRHLQDTNENSTVESKSQAAFILSAICRKNQKAQSLCIQAGLADVIVDLLAKETDEELLKWLIILCNLFDDMNHEMLLEPFFEHESPNVRAAAVFSGRGNLWRQRVTDGSQLVRQEVAVKALSIGSDVDEVLLRDPCLDVRYLAMMCMGSTNGGSEGSGKGKVAGTLPRSYQSKTWKKNENIEYQSPVYYSGEQTMRWPLLGPLAEEEPGAAWLKRRMDDCPKEEVREAASLRGTRELSIDIGKSSGDVSALLLEPWSNEVVVGTSSSMIEVYRYIGHDYTEEDSTNAGNPIKKFDNGIPFLSLFRLNDTYNEVLLCCGDQGVTAHRGYNRPQEDPSVIASFIPFDRYVEEEKSSSFTYSDQYMTGSLFAASDTTIHIWSLQAERCVRKFASPNAVRSLDVGKAANMLFCLDVNGIVGMHDLRTPKMNFASIKGKSKGSSIAASIGGVAVASKGGALDFFDCRNTSSPTWTVSFDDCVTCLTGSKVTNLICAGGKVTSFLDTKNGDILFTDDHEASLSRFSTSGLPRIALKDRKASTVRILEFT